MGNDTQRAELPLVFAQARRPCTPAAVRPRSSKLRAPARMRSGTSSPAHRPGRPQRHPHLAGVEIRHPNARGASGGTSPAIEGGAMEGTSEEVAANPAPVGASRNDIFYE
jgi:hypothetical protein